MGLKKSSNPMDYIDTNGFILRNEFPVQPSDFCALENHLPAPPPVPGGSQGDRPGAKLGFGIAHRGCQGTLSFVPGLDRPHSLFFCSENGPFNKACSGHWELHEVESMSPQLLLKTFYVRLPDFEWDYEVLAEGSNGVRAWTYNRPATLREVYKVNANALEYRRNRAKK